MSPEYRRLLMDFESKSARVEKFISDGDLESARAADKEADDARAKLLERKSLDDESDKLAVKALERKGFLNEPANTAAHSMVYGAVDRVARNDKGVEIGDPNKITTVETIPEYKGVFGSRAGFLFAVRAGSSPNHMHIRDATEKLNGWEAEMKKAPKDWLEVKAPSGMYEAGDTDGGILIPPEISQTLYERSIDEDNFLSEADVLPVRGNTMSLPALDDKSRANGYRYGGVQSYWAGEADTFTGSRPKFRNMDLRLHKLTCLIYLTSELIEDSPLAIDRYVSNLAAKEIAFKCSDAMFNGTGVGSPLGVLGCPAMVTIAKEQGQAAASLQTENIEKMWQAVNRGARKKGNWYINQDCEAALQLMAFPVGTAGVPIFQPNGVRDGDSTPRLKGRPVKTCEFSQGLGTLGDIMYIDWSFYQAITKGSVKTDMSMHIRFLFDELAYRFAFRVDGQCKWEAPLAPYKGSQSTSPVVGLATRA